MARQTALVSGGCGFVGRRFVRRLVEEGYRVTVVDDLSSGLRPEAWPRHLRPPGDHAERIEFHLTDFRDYTREAVADFDLIVHLAAVVGGRLTIEGDPLAVATDLSIDATLFNWVVKPPRPRKVLYFSSSAAYPICLQRPNGHRPLEEQLIRFEDQIGVPDLTYGWSKLTGEFLALQAVNKYGLDVLTYRPFSGYGEDQDFTYPFPRIVSRVLQQESPIVVWGSGDQLRDFIYIEDIVDAVFATAWKLPPGGVLNLGSGQGISFRDLARRVCEIAGHSAPIVNDSTKPEGVFARVGNCARLHEFYQPKVTLDQGIALVMDYLVKTTEVSTGVGS